MESVVDKFIRQLNDRMKDKKVQLELDQSARLYFAKKGYEPAFGARPLGRLIQTEITQVLSEEILFGKLEKGGNVVINEANGKLEFEYFELEEIDLVKHKDKVNLSKKKARISAETETV
jgi:ATP-dependent Clp protease ATP-binding subunit ClpA